MYNCGLAFLDCQMKYINSKPYPKVLPISLIYILLYIANLICEYYWNYSRHLQILFSAIDYYSLLIAS